MSIEDTTISPERQHTLTKEPHLFSQRHIGPKPTDIDRMLTSLGPSSLEELMEQIFPESIKKDTFSFDIPDAVSEHEALRMLKNIAQKNSAVKSLLGQGYHGTITPSPIMRNILENPGWYTAYTSYQSEISQGRLEALFNFQTLVCELTGLPIANASLLDESTAVAEAVQLVSKIAKNKNKILLLEGLHEQNIQLLHTRMHPLNIEIVRCPIDDIPLLEDFLAVIMQIPDTRGTIHDIQFITQKAKAHGVYSIASIDPLMMTLVGTPASWGIDIVVGSMQRFGVPMGYGGPHAAFFACGEALKRFVPGRLVGQSKDSQGRPAYRLALQTREQHIRRERATSNICTSQVLLAVMSSMYAVYHGGEGLQHIARKIHALAVLFSHIIQKQNSASLHSTHFFDTVCWSLKDPKSTEVQQSAALEAGYNIRRIDESTLSVSFDETCSIEDVRTLSSALFDEKNDEISLSPFASALPKTMRRNTHLLAQEIFNAYQSETDFMRYMRKLMDRDLALDRTMIPLGSCTMKLNAASELMPLSWKEFSDIHPFAPLLQTQGYRELITETENLLCKITGFDAVSLQPNAGSQGEYAGLLAIQAYHRSRGDAQRTICLIPSSAHGTNPASAVMAGMEVVVVLCDNEGNVNREDLEKKVEQYANTLAVLMLTYPSTHGVYEEGIKKMCELIHAHGGQIYIDGANLNALVGLVSLAHLGADASHMNLHKTFSIPHGGGGPGIGPVGVKKHLASFLPANILMQEKPYAVGPVSATPWGSASILSISWMYIRMMGKEGLQRATRVAVLNANYIAQRLAPHYDILYTGRNNYVAHECIIDTRPFKQSAGIMSTDIAKRLIDFGFHAPTMSWPVQNTLMIEPTESESLAEIERFCTAMITIREEIRKVEIGQWSQEDNPLVNAPHCAQEICDDSWTHAYSRKQAAYPVPELYNNKYWPPVSRVDDAFGDKNLVCSCSSFIENS